MPKRALADTSVFIGLEATRFDPGRFEDFEWGVSAVTLGELRLGLDVDLDDLDLVGQLAGDLVEQRRDHLAWAAPFGPEIGDDQFIGFNDLVVEIDGAD